jgi:uncharacterized protein (DUF488 family)
MTAAFRSGLDGLCACAREKRCAIICAEAVGWRCHRRIIGDCLVQRFDAVTHIMGPGKLAPARLTCGAQPLPDGTIKYPAIFSDILL